MPCQQRFNPSLKPIRKAHRHQNAPLPLHPWQSGFGTGGPALLTVMVPWLHGYSSQLAFTAQGNTDFINLHLLCQQEQFCALSDLRSIKQKV